MDNELPQQYLEHREALKAAIAKGIEKAIDTLGDECVVGFLFPSDT